MSSSQANVKLITHCRDSPWMGPDPFCENTINVLRIGLYFWLCPIYKLFKSHVNYALYNVDIKDSSPIKFCKRPIKISNGPLKFGNLHVFEWDMGHWSILRAHHYFRLGVSLHDYWNITSASSFRFSYHLAQLLCTRHHTQ